MCRCSVLERRGSLVPLVINRFGEVCVHARKKSLTKTCVCLNERPQPKQMPTTPTMPTTMTMPTTTTAARRMPARMPAKKAHARKVLAGERHGSRFGGGREGVGARVWARGRGRERIRGVSQSDFKIRCIHECVSCDVSCTYPHLHVANEAPYRGTYL